MLTRALSAGLLATLLLLAAPASAQSPVPAGPAASGEAATPPAPRAETPAEERVREIISAPGVHVVRLWAPWCYNSTRELADGWDRLVADNPEVSFTFVTVWNNGNGGAATMREHGLSPERVREIVPEKPAQGRLDSFMGYALNWVPSTWIFRVEEAGDAPERAFALNYGQAERATFQTLIDAASRAW